MPSERAPLSSEERRHLEHACRELERLRVMDLATSRSARRVGRQDRGSELEAAAVRHYDAIDTIQKVLAAAPPEPGAPTGEVASLRKALMGMESVLIDYMLAYRAGGHSPDTVAAETALEACRSALNETGRAQPQGGDDRERAAYIRGVHAAQGEIAAEIRRRQNQRVTVEEWRTLNALWDWMRQLPPPGGDDASPVPASKEGER